MKKTNFVKFCILITIFTLILLSCNQPVMEEKTTLTVDSVRSEGCLDEWNVSRAYAASEQCRWDGYNWYAKWWTQGETPGEKVVWQQFGVDTCSEGPTPTPTYSCGNITVWNAFDHWSSYSTGDLRQNQDMIWKCINVAYSYFEPSGVQGHYGWELVGPCYTVPKPSMTPLSVLNTTLINWGLGVPQTEYYCNDREYNWYIDQYDTGPFNYENCGPASVTMACKWADSTFTKTAEDARNTYWTDGGWWYTYDIYNYLSDHGIQRDTIRAGSDPQALKDELWKGNILLLCINISYIRLNPNLQQHVDGFFSGTGHFIVVKGYIEAAGTLFFEVMDPGSWNKIYDHNNVPVGKNRYYRWEDLSQAISNWWPYAFSIEEKDQTRSADTATRSPYAVDINDIPHVQGGF